MGNWELIRMAVGCRFSDQYDGDRVSAILAAMGEEGVFLTSVTNLLCL
jgi:hypothetical protein